jgi:hypothetical protein
MKLVLDSNIIFSDSPFLALAMALNCSIWSNDGHFKQQDRVFFGFLRYLRCKAPHIYHLVSIKIPRASRTPCNLKRMLQAEFFISIIRSRAFDKSLNRDIVAPIYLTFSPYHLK